MAKSTLCIINNDLNNISERLSFGQNVNRNNTKVISTECAETAELFSFAFPNISLFNSEQYYLSDIVAGSIQETIRCHENTTTCSIICNNSVSCFGSTFLINTAIPTIHCGHTLSCGYTVINVSDYNALSLHIICDDDSSCVQTQVIVDSVDNVLLDCIDSKSCADMTINLRHTINSSINCYGQTACDGITINTDSDNTTLNINEFSQNIVFKTPTGFNGNNLQCNPQNAYIQIGEQFGSISEEIVEISGDKLPCSDTQIMCNDTDSCNIEYIEEYNDYGYSELFNCLAPILLDDILSIVVVDVDPDIDIAALYMLNDNMSELERHISNDIEKEIQINIEMETLDQQKSTRL